MKILRKNNSVLIRNKIINLDITGNKKSLSRNKSSTFYLNNIHDTNGSKHINHSYFNQKPDLGSLLFDYCDTIVQTVGRCQSEFKILHN